MSRTKEFDDAIKRVTQNRGEDYGHPLDVFARASLIKYAVSSCSHSETRHALEMIGVKMARLCNKVTVDGLVDISGYARTIAMLLDEEDKRNGQT
jgi:translation initiation factor 2 alpha subunit (eIF-2alpha)